MRLAHIFALRIDALRPRTLHGAGFRVTVMLREEKNSLSAFRSRCRVEQKLRGECHPRPCGVGQSNQHFGCAGAARDWSPCRRRARSVPGTPAACARW